ncbi:cysteinyl-tRNA synthetase [Geodermatophilus bullaregiensis]|uniref:cysteine--tRNA ligase n=1 Tax=Geodermatophilus bullaregiensis TaxID=1564160 RepID=UPI001956BEB4|nr:cysteine--tRNA ligase [Geodermatophilus bullaregiensis]MBM7807243.1 cysteinyl-tRNA synthetase [Geodermatophilus bullaregiensis]
MSLRLYDTAARAVRDFTPLRAGQASMYVCGLTVQGPPHVGHVRAALVFDVLRSWLEHGHGLDVTLVRNVTDIDDKILVKAAAAGVPWWAWAYENELACTRAYDALGVRPPTYEPRATGHVPDMVELIERLVERGHAYAVDGDVYFDVRSFPGYGALTRQRVDDLEPAADTDTDERKRDPRDFALWKAHKPGEPDTAAWPTPWGRGRPGWHLECSAMAERYLGPEFDVHGGGLDLRFPHHENEQAQSRAAGDGFARYWLHNGWVTLGGEKMSKSLGNTALVDEVVARVRPVELRYYLVAPHYRSTIEFTDAALAEAGAAYRRLESFVQRAAERVGADQDTSLPEVFRAAMDDDLGTPAAVAAIHEAVREGNTALAAGDEKAVAGALGSVRAMLGVLGLDPLDPRWAGGGDDRLAEVTDGLVRLALEQRQAARARRDFATADALRDRLTALGVQVEDTPQGPRWELTR